MLGIGFKLSETPVASLRNSISTFLRREYSFDQNNSLAENCEIALDHFVQLKKDVDLVRTPSAISRHVLLRYYAQLDKIAQRFPCDSEASGCDTLRLQFTWNDSFCPRRKSTQTGVSFEKAAIMFNMGALESQLGLQTDRSTADGLKAACHHFMKAAGAFTEVKDKILEQTIGTRTPDMSTEGLGLLAFLMLAQAQACFYEKAIKDQMKDGIKAKLVHQALDYYVSALEFCRSSALAGVIDKSWDVHLQFQVHCMRAAMQYWQGLASKAVALNRGEGYGEEIARLIAADTECTVACKLATENKLPTALLNSAQSLQHKIRDHLAAAEKDNASVYLENIPKLSDLSAIGRASMVKPLAFSGEELQQELDGVDLFEQFVPKDLLLRADDVKQEIKTILDQTADKVLKSNEVTKEKLHAMGLPASIEAFERTDNSGMHTIWQRVQYVKVTTATAAFDLESAETNQVEVIIQQYLQKNNQLSDEAEQDLRSIELRLNEEEGEDNMCRQNYGGKKWMRPVSSSLNQNFRLDIDRYYRLLKEAKTSDAIVREKMVTNQEKLEMLSSSKESLYHELPRLEQDCSSFKDEIAKVSSLLMQLGQLVQEKDRVLHDFKESCENLNLLSVLLSGKKANDVTIDIALENEKQFFIDRFAGKISILCDEEQDLLDELIIANSNFEAKKESDHLLRERQAFLQRLSDAVDVFEQLESHVKEGAKFYAELKTRIALLHQTVADHCSARTLERRELEITLTMDEEMRQREIADAALAQKMSNDMRIYDTGGRNASDEALVRELAGSPTRYYPASTTPQQSASFSHDVAQQPQRFSQHLFYGNGPTSPASFDAYDTNHSQPPQQQQSYNIYQYPGQQQVYNQGHLGDSV
ncbi:Predicted signal transduction protein [Plasmopara halstedii]|uniref:Predicted signal transduction protein n=1 Tax=Plasmopara halstedii TaxID=4781 RepID=A0A0P1A6M5_PLAHL|nr:Predicted signal transduction protein [Plasmopara halstedii]CEG35821.1 Predicted signal transduction protein [Plasmopara halstedii]|eukprot:XP_024572190.1 Predicted signal transduction protein [Plasmopara halstedii]